MSLFNWAYARYVLPRWTSAAWLWAGIVVNLGPLLYFKYAGFLVANAAEMVHLLGGSWQPAALKILLPLGISFYTFRGLPTSSTWLRGPNRLIVPWIFSCYAFWPKVISRPHRSRRRIARLDPAGRSLDYSDFSAGGRRLLAGLFKKIVLADSLAPAVDMVFRSSVTPNCVDAAAAILGFGLQVYFDFSGYTDIALGNAEGALRLPRISTGPTLPGRPRNSGTVGTSRFPLDPRLLVHSAVFRHAGPSRAGGLAVAAGPMGLCGLWHEAAWTFIVWGLWHGACC